MDCRSRRMGHVLSRFVGSNFALDDNQRVVKLVKRKCEVGAVYLTETVRDDRTIAFEPSV